jgi:hypothetical protein
MPIKNFYYLNSEVEFKPPSLIPNLPKESMYDVGILNPEFSNWLKIFRVKPVQSKVYYLWPESEYQNHVYFIPSQTEPNNDYAEIKVIYSPAPCIVQQLSADYDVIDTINIDGLGKPILVNSGILHSIPQVSSILWCFSFKLHHVKTNQLVRWEKAMRLFQDYIE